MRKVVVARAGEHAAHKLTVRRADREPSGEGQQLGAGVLLELPPQTAGPLEKGYVFGAFEVGRPEDARVAML